MTMQQLVGGSYPSAEMQSVYSTAPADRAKFDLCLSAISHILKYNSVSIKKDKISSILTFSNKSSKLSISENGSLMRAKPLHSDEK